MPQGKLATLSFQQPRFSSGDRLGKYLIREFIARGGMGEVYRATDTVLMRDVALKTLALSLANNDEFVRRFQREAQSMAQMQHPNIAMIFDVDCDANPPYLTMEFLQGKSLLQEVKAAGPMNEDRALRAVQQVARALDFVHKKAVLHRDVKPANVIADQHGIFKLTDFGVSRISTLSAVTVNSGQIMGTADYMSPEQALSKPVDGRSDLYSLGALLHELLTGNVPFKADSLPSLLYMHVHQPPPDVRLVRPGVRIETQSILGRLLAKEPSQRPATGESVSLEIERILNPPSPLVQSPRTPAPAKSSPPQSKTAPTTVALLKPAQPNTRLQWIIGFAALMAMAALGGLALQMRAAQPAMAPPTIQASATARPLAPTESAPVPTAFPTVVATASPLPTPQPIASATTAPASPSPAVSATPLPTAVVAATDTPVPTATKVAEPTVTRRNTATALPAAATTATVAPVPISPATPTRAPAFSTFALTGPTDGLTYAPNQLPRLSWGSAGTLGQNDVYRVSVVHPQGIDVVCTRNNGANVRDYVRTLAGAGYRFVWTVRLVQVANPVGEGAACDGSILAAASEARGFFWDNGSGGGGGGGGDSTGQPPTPTRPPR